MTIWTFVLLLLGFIIIVKGGDWFVEAAVWVAEATGIPKILIGATIVSLATTLPEFFVSVIAVAKESAGLGIGNALGSVICNTGLILAISLLTGSAKVEKELFYKKAIIMCLSLVVLFVLSFDMILTPIESIPLFLLLAYFIYFNIKHVKKNSLRRQEEIIHIDTGKKTTGINIVKFIIGALGIVIGAELLVNNGIKIAAGLGVSESVIGVTVIAFGTSLPELVTTITSIRKKHVAMGIGNILGANILNVAMVLSTCALISGDGLQIEKDSLYINMPVAALLFMILLIPPFFFKGRFKRFQGAAMLAVYAAFIVFLIVSL